MAITFLEPGTDATYGLELFTSTSGTVASSSAQAKTGPRSVSITGTVGAAYVTVSSVFPAAGARVSFYIYLVVLPVATANIFGTTGGAAENIAIGTDGVLRLRHATSTVIGTGIAVLSTGTWYRISYERIWVASGNNSYRIQVNGVPDISVDNAAVTATSTSATWWGIHATSLTHYDDLYVDDSNSLTDPGDIRVTAKLPNALNTNNFDTGVGSGTNRYDRVSERAISTTNGWQHAGTSDVQENYTIQEASVGDVNISGANILGYTGWVYGKRGEFDANCNSLALIGTQSKSAGTTTVITIGASGFGTSGGAIFVGWAGDDNGSPGTTATCADSKGNTYAAGQSVQASATGSATGVRTALFAALNITPLVNGDTITITHGSITARAAVAACPNGIATSSALDKSNSAVQTSQTAPASGLTGTLTQANEVVVGVTGIEGDSGDYTASLSGRLFPEVNTSGRGSTQQTGGGGAASNIICNLELISVNATTSVQAGVTNLNTARDCTTVVGSYKAVTGGTSVGDPKLMLNGTEYSKTLPTSNALYSQVVTDANYPRDPAGIGMRSSGTTADTFLYECGVIVAYIPNFPPMFRRRRIREVVVG